MIVRYMPTTRVIKACRGLYLRLESVRGLPYLLANVAARTPPHITSIGLGLVYLYGANIWGVKATPYSSRRRFGHTPG
jgi:hypothetical protein